MSGAPDRAAGFWQRWLSGVLLGFTVVSLAMALVPSTATTAFSLLIYRQADLPADFSAEARNYIELTNAVLLSVMTGWFTLMFLISRRLTESPSLWRPIAAGLAIWFVPDTAYSLVSGYWENAVLNILILTPLAVPLAVLAGGSGGVRRTGRRSRSLKAGRT